MAEIPEDLQKNYRDLHESTGESYESISGRAETQNDHSLAAWLRSQAAGGGSEKQDERTAQEEAPKGRRSIKSETAAADGSSDDESGTPAAEATGEAK